MALIKEVKGIFPVFGENIYFENGLPLLEMLKWEITVVYGFKQLLEEM